jgi:response regulator RpfG family c-di-GMP phosphodiesterase
MRESFSRLFDEQWRVVAVADGAAALAAARHHQSDLVISAVMMPGVEGFALLAAIRDDPATSDTSVIFLSAYTGAPYEAATTREWVGAFLHPDDGPATLEAFEEARQTGKTLGWSNTAFVHGGGTIAGSW